MAKVGELFDVSGLSAVNSNNDTLEAAFDNTLSRDGSGPNDMEANLDMNGNRILNLPDAVSNQEPITLSQAAAIAGVTNPLTQESVGAVLYPRTTAEVNAGVTPTYYAYPPGNVLRYGAVGDGTTDDTSAIEDAISVASQDADTTDYAGTPVYFPAGTYLVSNGALTYGSSATGLIFYGDGPTSSTIKLNTNGTNQVYFYNNSGAQSYRNTYRDLRFLGSNRAYCNGFQLTDTAGWEKKFWFQNCRFEQLNYLMRGLGTTNADQHTWWNCEWYYVNTLAYTSNTQSMLFNYYGCYGVVCKDVWELGSGGGGEFHYWGGDLIHIIDDSTSHYLINGSAGPATGVSTGSFTFNNIRPEFRGQYSKLVYWPVSDITNRSRDVKISFNSCNLSTLNQGTGITRTGAVVVGEGKTVEFNNCVLPHTATGSIDDWGFTITADSDGAPGVPNPGTIRFTNCSVPLTLAERCTITNVYGVYDSTGSISNEGDDDTTDRVAVNFTKGFSTSTLGAIFAQPKLAELKRRYWPYSDGASGFEYEATVTLPAGAILLRAAIYKPSTASGSTNGQYHIGTDNKGTSYVTTTDADYRAEHAKSEQLVLAPLATATTFRLWLSETTPNTCTASQEGGYAYIEYI